MSENKIDVFLKESPYDSYEVLLSSATESQLQELNTLLNSKKITENDCLKSFRTTRTTETNRGKCHGDLGDCVTSVEKFTIASSCFGHSTNSPCLKQRDTFGRINNDVRLCVDILSNGKCECEFTKNTIGKVLFPNIYDKKCFVFKYENKFPCAIGPKNTKIYINSCRLKNVGAGNDYSDFDKKHKSTDIKTLIKLLDRLSGDESACINNIECQREYGYLPEDRYNIEYSFKFSEPEKYKCGIDKDKMKEECPKNIATGKCQCPNIINTFGISLYPHLYGKGRQ